MEVESVLLDEVVVNVYGLLDQAVVGTYGLLDQLVVGTYAGRTCAERIGTWLERLAAGLTSP